jgi:hypothetical protein
MQQQDDIANIKNNKDLRDKVFGYPSLLKQFVQVYSKKSLEVVIVLSDAFKPEEIIPLLQSIEKDAAYSSEIRKLERDIRDYNDLLSRDGVVLRRKISVIKNNKQYFSNADLGEKINYLLSSQNETRHFPKKPSYAHY